MDELVARYVEGLGARIEALEACLEGVATQDAAALDTARRVAHKLHGSGASFGLPAISVAGGAVSKAKDDELPARLRSLLACLRQTLAERAITQEIRILVVEDDADLGFLLKERLAAKGRRVILAGSAADAKRWVDQGNLDLVIMDIVLPDADGRELLSLWRENPRMANVPMVTLSGLSDARTKTECIALGADTFLSKPFDPELVAATVSSLLARSARGNAADSAADGVTGLPTRSAFRKTFERAKSLSKDHRDMAMAILDLDGFAALNARFGSTIGDQALRYFANELSDHLDPIDAPCRWGDDEFVVFFPRSSQTAAAEIVATFRSRLSDKRWMGTPGNTYGLSFSAGIASASQKDGLEEAVARADWFLFLAKQEGGDRTVLAKERARGRQRSVLLVEDDPDIAALLIEALEQNNFTVHHVSDGEAAFAEIVKDPFGMVLLDVDLPTMDGFEVLSRVRRIDRLRDLPILMVTAMGEERAVVQAFEMGADDFIPKPFSTAALLARIERMLARIGAR